VVISNTVANVFFLHKDRSFAIQLRRKVYFNGRSTPRLIRHRNGSTSWHIYIDLLTSHNNLFLNSTRSELNCCICIPTWNTFDDWWEYTKYLNNGCPAAGKNAATGFLHLRARCVWVSYASIHGLQSVALLYYYSQWEK
jgi:hypothetical protein